VLSHIFGRGFHLPIVSHGSSLWHTAVGISRASQKSKVQKASHSCNMKAIKKHFHGGETRNGLYNTPS
jgi:hypothetical protein